MAWWLWPDEKHDIVVSRVEEEEDKVEGHGQAAKEHHHGPRYNAEIENHLQISLQKERKKEREREREKKKIDR